MFEVLPASSTRAEVPAGHAVLSMVVHGTLVGVSILLTARASLAGPAHPVATPLYYTALPPRPAPVTTSVTPPIAAPTLASPLVEALPLPVIEPLVSSLATVVAGLHSVLGAPSGPVTGTTPGGHGVPGPGGAWSEAQVDDPVTLLAPGHLRYPPVLERAGVSGSVVVEFVVDTLGRVEPASVRVLTSSHPAFEESALEAVLASTFRPARAHGAVVRQLVRQKLAFVASGGPTIQ
jgi:protein TonB